MVPAASVIAHGGDLRRRISVETRMNGVVCAWAAWKLVDLGSAPTGRGVHLGDLSSVSQRVKRLQSLTPALKLHLVPDKKSVIAQ